MGAIMFWLQIRRWGRHPFLKSPRPKLKKRYERRLDHWKVFMARIMG
jgi:hypothetical protein